MKELNIPDIDLKKELKTCKSAEDLVGKNGYSTKKIRSCFGFHNSI